MALDRDNLTHRAADVRLAVFDVDGVMTDGRLFLSDSGREIKAFHSRDGLGLKGLMNFGVTVAVITARNSELVRLRTAELGIEHLYQNREDKRSAFIELLGGLKLAPEQSCYMGDDLIDWPVMRAAGLSLAPADAHPWIRERADWTGSMPAGFGAVREAAEMLLGAQGKLQDFYAQWD